MSGTYFEISVIRVHAFGRVNAETPNFASHFDHAIAACAFSKMFAILNTHSPVCLLPCAALQELGNEWLQPHLFRLGASSLVVDIERQLYHQATGQYANKSYMPMS